MFSAIAKALNLKRKSKEIIEFESSELKKNEAIWRFLKENKEQIGGALKEVIFSLEGDQSNLLEFAGGTLTIPSNLNCDINLYNHFREYFQVDYKIPMFLFHAVGKNSPEMHTKVLRNYEVFRKTFPKTNSPQVITYFTFGPKLCWGRHSRWRAQFDIFNEDATTAVTNHACHAWKRSQKIYCDLQGNDEKSNLLVVEGSADTNSLANIAMCNSVEELKPKDQQFNLNNGNAFNFFVNNSGQLSGNHIITSKKPGKKLKSKQFKELRKFKSAGIAYSPFILPHDNEEIHFGLWWPTHMEAVVLNYVTDESSEIKEIKLTGKHKVFYRHELTQSVGDLVVWQKYPEKISDSYDLNQPMLICRNKNTNDQDFTEFQSCWRNQGFESDVFPHWLGNFKAMKPSSRLTGVVNFNLFDEGRLYLQALKPTHCANVNGHVEVNIFDRFGDEIDSLKSEVNNKKCLSFEFSKNNFGSDIAALRVRSTDIDFTANLLQWNSQGATSLQHLWGY